jgi:hypothetical protein
MAVVALWLGILTTVRFDPPLMVFLTCWLLVVGILRAAVGAIVAALVSAGAGTLLKDAGTGDLSDVGVGALIGLAAYLVLEVVIRVVNWLDTLMRHETTEKAS